MQFPEPKIDPISTAVTPIELIADDNVFGHGTGFIWSNDQGQFLITNWHNLSGQNPFDGSYLNLGGKVPDSIRIYPAYLVGPKQLIQRTPVTIPLFETFHEPTCKQHRHFLELRIDIAAIKLDPAQQPEQGKLAALNQLGDQPKLFSHVGSNVFVVGYPFAEHEDLHRFPLWKRGSIASEPLIGWQGRPIFLIDAASRPGMSGSPVIRKIFGPAPIWNGDEFYIQGDSIMRQEFVGIYSGHLRSKQQDVTIGIAWYGKLIPEVLANPDAGCRL